MGKNNHCLFTGKDCEYATLCGECIIGEQNCKKDVPSLTYEDFEDYLFGDLIDEEK